MLTVINETAQIYLIDHFLTSEECSALIEKSERIGYEEAKVNVDGGQKMMKTVRNNERIMYENPAYATELWNKVRPFVKTVVGNSTAIGLNEMFRFYKYSPGQRFKMHRDGSFIRNEAEFSIYTFMIYLNEGYEGGETKFASGEIIAPQTGTALIFEHRQRHEGATLVNGTKYVLRSDIMYKHNDK